MTARLGLFSAFVLGGLAAAQISPVPASRPKPKLVVAIIVDQFRYDYLTRFRADYHGGLDHLLTNGADFTNAFYDHVPTVTAVGHSIFLSGAMPSVSGIVGNSWFDRDEAKVVTSVCDWSVRNVGADQPSPAAKCTDADPASPKRLLVTTLGDELRAVSPESKVIGISLKPRAAILPSGHRANAAFWFDDVTGNFISSSFYMAKLPAWVDTFNERKLAAAYIDKPWESFPKWNFRGSAKELYSKLPASPWGNELIEQFAEQSLDGEKLGQRQVTDLLTISFSSNDYVGHSVGPDAPEVRDMALRTDQLLAKLFQVIDRQVGLTNVVIVLSADHGVANIPDPTAKIPGGYIKPEAITREIEAALNSRYGTAEWLLPAAGENVYFNYAAIQKMKTRDGQPLTLDAVCRAAKEALLLNPDLHLARIYTRDQLDQGVAGDFIARAEVNGFNPKRSGDLALVFEPGYIPGSSGTTHYSPYGYDTHVPLIFMGSGIKPGRFDETVRPNDIAPTLAALLDLQTPSGSSGRVLTEMFAR
ncbi:MAG: alkaline phosphatase family protein [Acidobacteriaceae bacterium]|nr:alkaline phosphatase family protein [Acidobacteriaceae bacterium]